MLSCADLDSSTEISWARKLNFALDTGRGMAYLHKLNVIHRDLKSHNLLVSASWRVKIADFGTSRLVDALHQQKSQTALDRELASDVHGLRVGDLADIDILDDHGPQLSAEAAGGVRDPCTSLHRSSRSGSSASSSWLVATMTTAVGSPLWMSPELFLQQPYGPSTDVYSYAMVLFEIIEQTLPWAEVTGPVLAILENEVPKGRRPLFQRASPGDQQRALQDLMISCWAHDPAQRPTFEAVIEDQCFAELRTTESEA